MKPATLSAVLSARKFLTSLKEDGDDEEHVTVRIAFKKGEGVELGGREGNVVTSSTIGGTVTMILLE